MAEALCSEELMGQEELHQVLEELDYFVSHWVMLLWLGLKHLNPRLFVLTDATEEPSDGWASSEEDPQQAAVEVVLWQLR